MNNTFNDLYASTYNIALLSQEQLACKTKAELSIMAKTLGLTGYTKLNKPELSQLVYKASNVLRAAIINEQLKKDEVEKEKILRKHQNFLDESNADNVISVHSIEKVASQFKENEQAPENTAKVLYELCQRQGYAPITIAKEQSRRLRVIFEDNKLSEIFTYEFKDRLYQEWLNLTRPITVASRLEDEKRIQSYAIEAEKTIDATEAIIQWAKDNLNNTKRIYLQAIAIGILSGRRMAEICGDAKFSEGKVGVIITGLAKKKGDDARAEFVPLCDVDEFLTAINKYPKRGYTPRQVNKNIGATISKQFPKYLKELGLEKFKDCRDFYGAVMYESFKLAGAREPKTFTKYCMGHESEEATNYYRKFEVKGVEDLIPILKDYMVKPYIS